VQFINTKQKFTQHIIAYTSAINCVLRLLLGEGTESTADGTCRC
jgi:hypothetical protein